MFPSSYVLHRVHYEEYISLVIYAKTECWVNKNSLVWSFLLKNSLLWSASQALKFFKGRSWLTEIWVLVGGIGGIL
ncbi:hypothetical protein CsatB_009348 [Cannabis sativa]